MKSAHQTTVGIPIDHKPATSGLTNSAPKRRYTTSLAILCAGILALLGVWVAPAGEMRTPTKQDVPIAAASATNHWAFAPLRTAPLPKVRRTQWAQSSIDRFILARLEKAGLRPAPPADRSTLLRRLSFDLIGLPPTPEEIDAFTLDRSPSALTKVVDRLLASPHYGERWGRHWLDVARYADSNGQDENKAMAHAWRYRDYVIASFNHDKPFNQFIQEQLAGDLLPPAADERVNLERRVATGFLVLGPKMLAEQDKPKLVMDVVDEQIDVVSRAFLGLTVSCSRCHDHKFDPIPTRDYYALAGIFKSTKTMSDLAFVSKWNERSVATQDEIRRSEAYARRTAELEAGFAAAVRQADEKLREGGPREVPRIGSLPMPENIRGGRSTALAAPWASPRAAAVGFASILKRHRAEPPPDQPIALAVEEAAAIDLPVHTRGSHLSPAGQPIPRGFVSVVHVSRPTDISKGASGRRQLADWLTDPDHPLTARVTVNRIWQSWFGEGLVRTPDNFGLRGEPPTHPELLDWLAREFIDSGWSVKRLHRLIALSSAYQMSTAFDARAARVDPDNQLLWRMNRRRLEAEPLRDSLLATAGRLDLTMGGTLVSWANAEYTPADSVSAASRRRAVYLPVVRDRVYDVFTTFDFANPSVGVCRRTPTVVSHQALFFLNSPFVREQALQLAESIIAETGDDDSRIRLAYRKALSRMPRPNEIRRAARYLEETKLAGQKNPSAAAKDGGGSNAAPQSDAPKSGSKFPRSVWAGWCQALLASNEFLYLD